MRPDYGGCCNGVVISMKKRKSRLHLLSTMLVRSKLFSTAIGEGRGWVRLSRSSEEGFHALMSVTMRYLPFFLAFDPFLGSVLGHYSSLGNERYAVTVVKPF